jgi:hypothetical protein
MGEKFSGDLERLFWTIFNTDNEEEVNQVITTNPLLKNEDNWFPYGGLSKNDRTNFGTFENQQPSPIPALVEKVTNSIDSLLLKHCRLTRINPKSPNAPNSMQEAVEKFFGIKNGDFSEIGEGQRRRIAENIQIVATGDKDTPSLLVYDNGEGQHPDDFPVTFLSLRRNNKTDIRFVQGKYNMGSTGAVVFCGTRLQRYQLVASKLCDDLNTDGRSNDFGFTLVRRHPLTEEQETQYGSSWYEYFVVDDRIPRFAITTLDLGLSKRKPFATGSIVKLYSYHLPRGSRTDITFALWRDLNQFLYQPALPFLLVERRYGGHAAEAKHESKLVLGNKTRIVIDDRERKEKTISMSLTTADMGRVNIEATVFKHDVEQREFVKDKAVVFTVNGQVHGFLPRRFVSDDLGLPMLRDSLLLQVDCTNTRTSFRQDLFMANRYNLKEGEALQVLLDRLIQEVKSNEDLKELNQNRKNRILRDNKADEEILRSLIQSIPFDKDLINLLKKNGNLDFFKSSRRAEDIDQSSHRPESKSPYVSNRFPSIFRLDLKEDVCGKRVKSVPLNGKGTLEFETDVEDEYLFRPHERGELQLQILGIQNNDVTGGTDKGKPKKVEDVFNVTVSGPTNNSIKITFEPKDNLAVGDQVALNAQLSSPSGNLESIFYVKIVNPQKQQDKPKEDKPLPPALPLPIRVYEKAETEDDRTWKDFNWTGDDIVRVIPAGESENVIDAIAINMDSFVVKRYLSKNRINTESSVRFVKDKFFTSVYLHSLFLYGIFDKLNKCDETEYDMGELIPKLMKPYSSFLLYANTDETLMSSLKSD